MAPSARLAFAALRRLAELTRSVEAPTLDQPPAGRRQRAFAATVSFGFGLSIFTSAALVLGLLAVHAGGAALDWLKLVLGLALMAEGLLLTKDWRGARRLTLRRIRRRRSAGDRRTRSVRKRLVWALASPALQVIGFVWLTLGFLLFGLALARLV